MAKIPNDEERKEIDLEPIYEKPKKLVEQEAITKFHFNPDSYQVDYDSGDITFADDMPTIPANTLRARIVGFPASGDTFLTIGASSTPGLLPALIPMTIGSAP